MPFGPRSSQSRPGGVVATNACAAARAVFIGLDDVTEAYGMRASCARLCDSSSTSRNVHPGRSRSAVQKIPGVSR